MSYQIMRPRRSPNVLQRIGHALRSFRIGPLSLKDPALAKYFTDGYQNASGVHVNERNALTYAAFWGAVNVISTDVASLPLITYRRLGTGGKERDLTGRLYGLLHDRPNPEMSAIVFRETLQGHVLTWGNGYAEIERDGAGRPLALWPITPDRVKPYREKGADGSLGRLTYLVDGTVTIDAMNMLHIPGLGFDGTCGYSVVHMARQTIGLGLGAERFGGSFFGNGSTFGGVLTDETDSLADEEKRKELLETLQTRHQGVDRAYRMLLLYGGLKYQPMPGIPPKDSQYLEGRLFQVNEVCRWFRLAPYKLQDLTHATFSNVEALGIAHVTDTIRPWAVRWEQEINYKLIAPELRGQTFVEHLFDALLRGDTASRYQAYAIGRQQGFLSADEIRERENLNPLPNGTGGTYLEPLNMIPAGSRPAGNTGA